MNFKLLDISVGTGINFEKQDYFQHMLSNCPQWFSSAHFQI